MATSAIGSTDLSAGAPIAPFLAPFVLLGLLYLALVVRAQRSRPGEPLPEPVYHRVLMAIAASTGVLATGLVIALWLPALALAMALVSSAPTILILRNVPVRYRHLVLGGAPRGRMPVNRC